MMKRREDSMGSQGSRSNHNSYQAKYEDSRDKVQTVTPKERKLYNPTQSVRQQLFPTTTVDSTYSCLTPKDYNEKNANSSYYVDDPDTDHNTITGRSRAGIVSGGRDIEQSKDYIGEADISNEKLEINKMLNNSVPIDIEQMENHLLLDTTIHTHHQGDFGPMYNGQPQSPSSRSGGQRSSIMSHQYGTC